MVAHSYEPLQIGLQPLHVAAVVGNIDIAEYLVMECGVPIEPAAEVMSNRDKLLMNIVSQT